MKHIKNVDTSPNYKHITSNNYTAFDNCLKYNWMKKWKGMLKRRMSFIKTEINTNKNKKTTTITTTKKITLMKNP